MNERNLDYKTLTLLQEKVQEAIDTPEDRVSGVILSHRTYLNLQAVFLGLVAARSALCEQDVYVVERAIDILNDVGTSIHKGSREFDAMVELAKKATETAKPGTLLN